MDLDSASAGAARYRIEFRNETTRPFRYFERYGQPSHLALSLFTDGTRLRSHAKKHRPSSRDKSRLRTLKPNEAFVGKIYFGHYRDLKPGRYEIRAEYDIKEDDGYVEKFGLTPLSFNRTVMIVDIIESLPKKLNNLTQLKIKRVTENSHYFLGVDVGLGSTWDKKATLFVALRESDPGKAKLNDPPKKIFRPLRLDPKARVETMAYNPFPLSTEPIIQLHVLVTEPNKPQRHLVIGGLASGASVAEIEKDETLKPGKLYQLHKDPLGSVKIVPRVQP